MKAGLKAAVAAGVVAYVAAVAVAPAQASSDGSGAAGKRGECKLTRNFAQSTFASYINVYSAKNTSCGDAKKVIAAYHDCRKANGGRGGHCDNSVMGYSCKEKRYDKVPGVQYSADVVCKSGSKKVKHSYTMNL